jgi:hypothetical protein
MSLNFNVSPYYDDFDPSKNFHRILFKPGYAVQARELTQSQTILQDQISKFADNIFSQNTPVTGGKVTTNLKCYYLKLNTTYGGTAITASNFLNKIIQDSTGTILAKVIATTEATGTSSNPGDPPTLIISYISGAQFTDNLFLTPTDGTQIFATTIGSTGGTTCTGFSSVASISDGVFYIVNGYSKSSTENADGTFSTYSVGNFVSVQPQTIILNKYSNTPSYRIGLEITETIADYITDSSLLDPAIGASNYQAPGADRYQIILTLTTLPLTLGNDDQFIELVRIDNGSIVKQVDGTVYSVIDDYFAKRDYETNGDYVVNDFKLTPSPATASNQYNLNIGPGVAYVRGYRVENPSQTTLVSDRARTKSSVPSNSVFVEYGNYFVVDTLSGIFDVTTMPSVDLHCVQSSSINGANNNTYNSTLVGTAFMRGLQYQSSSGSNTTSYMFNAYVSDINTNNLIGTVGSATTTTLTISDPTDVFANVANAYYGMTINVSSGIDGGDTRTITNYNGTTKTFTVSSPFTLTPNSGDSFILNLAISNINSIVQKSGTGPYTITANTNINSASGKLNGIPNGPTVLQAAGSSEMIFPVGYPYVASVANTTYYSTQTFRNQGFGVGNQLTINTSAPVTFQGAIGTPLYGNVFKALFTVIDTVTGKILDFSTSSNYVTLTSSTSATFTSPTYSALGHNVDIYASVFVSNGDGSSNIIKTKTLKSGSTTVYAGSSNSATAVTGTTSVIVDSNSNPIGQVLINHSAISRNALSLYVTDVKGIAAIYDTGSSSATPSNGGSLTGYTNITSYFSLDNGQRDNYYDFASIKLLPGVPLPTGNLVVVFNYYLHGGGNGYFNINSYTNEVYSQIPTYLAKDGITYSLKDCMDWRPSRVNAQTSYVWEYSSSFSPSGMMLPNNLSNIQNNYTYYLGRKDKLILSKDNSFSIIEGVPAVNPQPPVEPNGSLVLANLTLDPYTSFVPGENPDGITSNLSINKIVHKRWAKSDITDLQTQVNNLEYYTSLSLLEQNAQSLQVPDSNGINRFKNGILVDDFSSFASADTSNPSYAANINIRTNQLSPITSVTNFQLQNPQVLQSYGTLTETNTFAVSSVNGTQTNLFTLPYTTKELLKQPLASSAISVNPFSVVVHQGVAQLNPPMDNWVNTVEVPALLVTDPNLQTFQQAGGVNLTNAGDWQSLPGTAANFVTAASTSQISNDLAYGVNSSTSGINGITPITGTYSSQLTSTNSPTSTSTALVVNNGFITNSAVLPNIRPQQIIVKANGLLVNTPVSCYFDGQNVNQFMTTPNTIELTGVSGTFNEDDIVGFYQNGFYPIARVVSVYYYPNGTSVRLYVASYVNVPSAVATTTLQNANFDGNGNYTGTTASGTVPSSTIIHTSASGEITGVGGGFTVTGNNTPSNVYNSAVNQSYCSFLNQYGVWGDAVASAAYNASYSIVPSVSGTYTITASAGSSATVSINGSSVLSVGGYTQTYTTTYSFTKGSSYTLSWAAINNTGIYFGAAFGLTVTDPSGNIIFNTLTPASTGISYLNASETQLVGGGAFFTNVTSVQLDQNASSINGYYNGATITIRTTYVQAYNYGAIYYPPPAFSGDGDAGNVNAYYARLRQYQSLAPVNNPPQTLLGSSSTYSVTILSYNGTTKVATFAPSSSTAYISTGSSSIAYPNISLGINNQYGIINSTYSINGTLTNTQAVQNPGTALTQLTTNEIGNFTAIFNVPGSVFSTGQRVFRIDNRTVAIDPSTATTYAEATFTASGLQTNNQGLNFSASVDASVQNITSLNQQSNSVVTSYLNSVQPHVDPIAQTFIVSKDNYPNGVFLNSVKLFFATKPSENIPVTVSLVGTLNGVPNGKTLDYSTVTMYPSQVNVSSLPYYSNSATYTEFVFNAPVYIQPGLLYAVIVQSNSTDYELYYGQQNQLAISSTTPGSSNPSKIGAAPYVGALFESQNSITWTADQTKDLMFVLTQCVFDTTQTPTISFVVPKGLPFRKLGVNDVLHNLSQSSVSNLYGTYMAANTPMHAFNLSTTDFVPSVTNISYQYSATLLNGQSSTPATSVTPGKFGTPTPDNIYLNDGQGSRVLLAQSNSSFSLYATMISSDPNVSPVISDDGLTLYDIAYFINNMGIDSNVISVANTGAGYNVSTATISISAPDIGSNTPVLGFTTNTTTGSITSVYTTYPGSGYLTSPTITISDSTTRSGNANVSIVVHGETAPSGGNAYAKYYTKKVVMTPGNDSGDMRVYYTAYKPVGTGVYIYYRILSSEDTSVFENQGWQLMTQVGNPNTYSTNRTNLIEYECAPGIFASNQANNNISYTSTNGQTYTNFIQFAIKVVMTTSDNTNVPFLTDLRALALPAGTGI